MAEELSDVEQRILVQKWQVLPSMKGGYSIYTDKNVCVGYDMPNHTIAQYIVDEHNKALDSPEYDALNNHWRMVEATQKSSRLERKVVILEETIKESQTLQDMPLWKRIAMQRREIKVLHVYISMYRKWWQEEKAKNNG